MNSGHPLLRIDLPENYPEHQEKSRIQCPRLGTEKLHLLLQEWNHKGLRLQFEYWNSVMLIFWQLL